MSYDLLQATFMMPHCARTAAGKTTLINHILTGEHGKKVAVIENEYGGEWRRVQQLGGSNSSTLWHGMACAPQHETCGARPAKQRPTKQESACLLALSAVAVAVVAHRMHPRLQRWAWKMDPNPGHQGGLLFR